MSRNPHNARGRAEQLLRGIDPDAQGHDAVATDIARATDSPAPRQLDAGCIRSTYEAIADALEADESGTGRAARVFSQELAQAAATGARLAAAWEEAARTIRSQASDPVFQVLVDAGSGVLRERGSREVRTAAR